MDVVKLAIALIGFVVAIGLAGQLRSNPKQAQIAWTIMGLAPFGLPFFLPNPDFAFYAWPGWQGTVKGLQVSLFDFFTIAVLFSVPAVRHSLPFKLALGLYFVAVFISTFTAQVSMAADFYLWQLARVMLGYAAIVRLCADPRSVESLLTGLAIGICGQAILVVWQRFGLGMLQTPGSFGHQNFLSLAGHFVIFPMFALLLAGRRTWQTIGGTLSGVVIAVLTVSRAGLGLVIIGLALLFLISIFRKWTAWKLRIAMIAVVVAAIAGPIAISSFENRFGDSTEAGDYDERAALERAASMMLTDHPAGIGANNFVMIANTSGYYSRGGVAWVSNAALVHNSYFLAACETGYFGAGALIFLLATVIWTAFRSGWRHRQDDRGDLLLGLGVSVLIVAIHIKYEWVFFVAPLQYLLMVATGLIGGLSRQVAYPLPFGAQSRMPQKGKLNFARDKARLSDV